LASGAAAHVQHRPLRLRIHEAQERAGIIVVVIGLHNLGKQRRATVPVLLVAHRRASFAILAPRAVPVQLLNGEHRFHPLQEFESRNSNPDSQPGKFDRFSKGNNLNHNHLKGKIP
jgi:hypothetical protein